MIYVASEIIQCDPFIQVFSLREYLQAVFQSYEIRHHSKTFMLLKFCLCFQMLRNVSHLLKYLC